MKFEEVLPLLKQGKKVHRKTWIYGDEFIFIRDNEIFHKEECPYTDVINSDDILADDWEPYCPELTVKDLKEAIKPCPDDAKVVYSDTWNHPLFGVIYDRVHNVVELCDKLRLKEYYADSK